jgi:hypothetical protein
MDLDVLEAFSRSETASILPEAIPAFTADHFSHDLGSRLLISPRGLLGAGAFGIVYEAAMCTARHPIIVAVKFQMLPEEVDGLILNTFFLLKAIITTCGM